MAAFNSRDQIVISVEKERIREAVQRANGRRKKGVLLSVSCAAYSPLLMRKAHEGMKRLLCRISFRDPKIPIVANATGELCTSGAEIKQFLLR